ncbi:gliding motility-associated C-terminal domain-containing protein [bacterium]|nr:gliding motility-associated C-terminal domain-containing protein [bacterium]
MAVGQDSLTACVGDTIFLNASGADEYEWFHDASLSCDTCSAPYIILTDTSTYVVVKGTSSFSQMATNGNFSSGNTGFLTAYTYNATSIWNEGTYAVGPNPNAVHPNFSSWGDHTTGTGNYMLVNGSTGGNKILWRQIVSFPPGVQVTMRWWMLTFVTPAGSLQLKLAGTNIGNAASTPNSTGVWAQTTRTFTVPASGNATINLVTTSAALSGNDFGIDDISFQYTCESYDTVWIAPKSDAQILIDTTALFACDSLCFTLDNALDSLGLLSYQWVLSDGTIDSSSTFTHCLVDSGNYSGYLITSSSEGCTDSVALPSMRVGYTRRIDSLVIANDGSGYSGMVQVLNSDEIIGINVYYESVNSNSFDSIFFSAGSQSWSNGAITGSHLMTGWGPVVLNPEPQTICAYLYTADGCVDSLCRQIAFYPTIAVPNFFTPNGDMINDVLEIQSTNTDRLLQRIYNRWGQLVFETEQPDLFWDGNVNGKPAAAGVYFLEVEASNLYTSGRPIMQRKAIHLIK